MSNVEHGHTPAAWTAVIIIMLAFLVGTLGVILGQWVVFWVGVGLAGAGVVAGKVMQMMGMGMAVHPGPDAHVPVPGGGPTRPRPEQSAGPEHPGS